MPKTKYYAVRKGHQPGIYLTWPECQRQVNNFRGNEYKSFETLDEARSYLALANVSSPFTQPAEAPSHAFMPAAAATADPYTSASSNYSFTPSAAAPATAAITLFAVATGALYRMEFDGASKDRSAYSTPSSSQRAFSLLLHASSNPPQALYRMEFDGASKGNPGRAGAGSVLRDEHGNELVCMKEGVGHGTCNMAEYRAFIGGVELALALGITRLHVQGDSMLVVMQVQGKWKVNAEMLREPCRQAQQLVCRLREIAIRHVPRECNQFADRLSNEAVPLAEGERVIDPSTSTHNTHPLHGFTAHSTTAALYSPY
ncbi:unnamed protein product [Closterium sp. NIES-65]|nr:unnamed protein product [Closterium sp. NIES-65]